MKLSEADADLFFKLMWGLQFHVNRKRRLLPGVRSVKAYAKLSRREMARVRNVLWKDPGLIDEYVAGNPDGLAEEERAIVEKWKRFVSGTFYIHKLLKKHAVFIAEDSKVYAVQALHEPLEEVILGRPLPVTVTAVLLPFKGKIVYDGILGLYNITFGGGIRRRMNEIYMTAKQRGRILETLEPEEAPRPVRRVPEKPGGDWKAMLDDTLGRGARLKGGSALQRAAIGLVLSSARLARRAVVDPDDAAALQKAGRSVKRALTRWQRTLVRDGS